jgi:exonuclease III
MKALIWNSEGFRDTNKHLFVTENIREQKLDIVALLETGRSNFSSSFLRHLSGGRDFRWFCLPPHGRSGGILVGFNEESFHVKNVDNGEFCIKFHLRSKLDGFEWCFVAVYGAAQELNKHPFLAELVRFCDNETLPIMVGGDFNIIRNPEEKNLIFTNWRHRRRLHVNPRKRCVSKREI